MADQPYSIRRTFSDPDGFPVTSIYEITTAAGVTYTLTRQFYAHGPSMFEWELRGDGTLATFASKKAALRSLTTGAGQ